MKKDKNSLKNQLSGKLIALDNKKNFFTFKYHKGKVGNVLKKRMSTSLTIGDRGKWWPYWSKTYPRIFKTRVQRIFAKYILNKTIYKFLLLLNEIFRKCTSDILNRMQSFIKLTISWVHIYRYSYHSFEIWMENKSCKSFRLFPFAFLNDLNSASWVEFTIFIHQPDSLHNFQRWKNRTFPKE